MSDYQIPGHQKSDQNKQQDDLINFNLHISLLCFIFYYIAKKKNFSTAPFGKFKFNGYQLCGWVAIMNRYA
jgi:hypothetical protein